MANAKAVIVKTRSKKFRVKYYAGNGEPLAVSEILETPANADKNIKAMKKLCKGTEVNVISHTGKKYKL